MPGFGLLVFATGTRPFVIQKDRRRETVGRTPLWTFDGARAEARKRLMAIDARRPLAPTFEEPVRLWHHSADARGLSPRTVEDGRHEVRRHLSVFLPARLDEITGEEVAELHASLSWTRPDGTGGPYMANRVIRILKSIYNVAA